MLTNKQIKHLRTLAHPLGFILQTGDKGLTESFQEELGIALKAHELIKVKLNAERDERETMIADIQATQQCDVVQYIGKTVTLFKQKAKDSEIILPK